ncbi:MAG: signal peptide peptidase SppA [Armatimonadetes bacterium]|nr:signal peptide peptidase SppA [Armatimonadota bacterium]
MSRRAVVILVVVILVIVVPALIATVVGLAMLIGRDSSLPFGGDEIAMIRVEGIITSGRGSSGMFGGGTAGAERIVGVLEEFRKDRSVKAAVIRINSPGGSPAGSQEIYREIMRVRRAGKKITVSMGDVGASGAYYIASAADRIFANPATITGSIGVIMETSDIHELLNRVGADLGAIKSGKYKDIGSYSRPMTPDERRILQRLSDDVYDQFVTDVSVGRKMPKEDILKLADGRVFTGRQALQLKLVDRIGSLEDAMRAAAQDAGISGEFRVTEYERERGLFDVLFGPSEAGASSFIRRTNALSELAERLLRAGPVVEAR